MKSYVKVALSAVCVASMSPLAFAEDACAPYKDTQVEAKLNVTVDKDTDVVHFVRDNVDPDVVTKTYVLKYADPYELRGYLREIVQSRKVDESDTGIQAIKYTDGTGILMVSAEDYRFESSENGQGIDSIIEALDQPKVVSVTGQPMYLYSPKYRAASELRAMVKASGASVADDVTENIGGSDRLRVDAPLNLMFFKTTQFSKPQIETALKTYDTPYPEVRAKITVYEIYAENDAKVGLDFQAWKNGDGLDLFNGGGRFMKNYAPDGSQLMRGTGWSDTKFFSFNPKWSTQYIDFLASKGKAKVLHTCELTARNHTTAEIDRTTQVFLPTATKAEDQQYEESYLYLADFTPDNEYTVVAYDNGGNLITINANDSVTLSVVKLTKNDVDRYVLTLKGGTFSVDGNVVGSKIKARFVEVTEEGEDEPMEFTENAIAAQKGNSINLDASDEFGFHLALTPSISEKATMLDVSVSNSSLIGYTSEGAARIQQGAVVESNFMISNEGTKLVIGGIEKRDVVSVSGGVPVLKDIPFLGWLFSTESESTKKSQLLVVAEVVPVRPGMALEEPMAQTIKTIDGTLEKAGESNTFGYRQYVLDANR